MEKACELASVPYQAVHNSSKLAKHLISVLENILNEPAILEKKFEWLVNSRTNRQLRIDAFFPSYNLAVEVDGEQHYKDCDMFYKNNKFPLSHSLTIRQSLDKTKERLIREHNINFLRLTFEDGKKTTTQKLHNLLKGQGISA